MGKEQVGCAWRQAVRSNQSQPIVIVIQETFRPSFSYVVLAPFGIGADETPVSPSRRAKFSVFVSKCLNSAFQQSGQEFSGIGTIDSPIQYMPPKEASALAGVPTVGSGLAAGNSNVILRSIVQSG
jgi:hypothetical protein